MIELLKNQDVKDFGYFDIFSDQEVLIKSKTHIKKYNNTFWTGKRRLEKVFKLANLPSAICKW